MQPFSRGESAFSLADDYNFGIVIFQMNWQDYYCIMKEFCLSTDVYYFTVCDNNL